MIAAGESTRSAASPVLDRLAQLGVPLADLTADSRAVKLGSSSSPIPAPRCDGRAFIAEAIARGAAAVLWERAGFAWDERWNVPNLGIENLRGRISEIAGHVYGDPSERAVDGGRHRHQRQDLGVAVGRRRRCDALGRRSAVIGTLGNGLVGERAEARNTTPDAIVLQRLLAEYLRRGARCVAMEVSSHGLDQGRVAGIKYDVAVFTNLTRDHLDYHGTMESYAEAKFRLFSARGLRHAVVNVDDAVGRALRPPARRRGLDVIDFGTRGGARPARPRLAASALRLSEAGVRFRVVSEWGEGEVAAAALGAFNVSNLLAVLGDAARGGRSRSTRRSPR